MVVINYEIVCSFVDVFDGIDGVEVFNDVFFNEFVVCLLKNVNEVVDVLVKVGVFVGVLVSCFFLGQFEDVFFVVVIEINIDEDIVIFDKVLWSVF